MNLSSIERVIVKNAPTIFTGLSMVGVVGTAAAALKFAPKAKEAKEDIYQSELKHDDQDKAKNFIDVYKYYIPIVLCAGGTIFCIWESNHISMKREAAMMSALTAAYKYREEVKEAIGEKKEKDIYNRHQQKLAADKIADKMPPFDPSDGKMWCYEPVSEQFFQTTKERLLWAEMILNKELANNWGITFNKWLSLLGCKPYKDGKKIGWYVTDAEGFWDNNWSYFATGNPWITINPVLINLNGKDALELVYDVNPDMTPEEIEKYIEENDEEPEQYIVETVKKGTVVKNG